MTLRINQSQGEANQVLVEEMETAAPDIEKKVTNK